MGNPIGLVVQEVDLPESPLLTPAETTNLGALIRSERGIPNFPVRINNDFGLRNRYGDIREGEYGVVSLRELFTNAAPFALNVYASRIVGAGSAVAATVALGVGQTTFKSIRQVATVAADIFVKIEAGTVEGLKITFFDDAIAPTVTEVYDDITAENAINEINFGLGNGPGQSALARIETWSGVLPPQTLAGTTDGTTASKLVDSAATFQTDGVQIGDAVLNTTDITTALVTAVDSETELSLDSDVFVTGEDYELVSVTLVEADGQYRRDFVTTGLIAPVIKAGQFGQEDPGVWANTYAIKFTGDVNVPDERSLEIYKKIDGEFVLQGKIVSGLNAENWQSTLNNNAGGSGFIVVSTANAALPEISSDFILLTAGADGADPVIADFVGTAGNGKGLHAFSTTPVSVMTSFDIYVLDEDEVVDFAQAMDIYVETVKKRTMAMLNYPEDFTLNKIEFLESTVSGLKWVDLFRPKSFLAPYKGWVDVDNEKGGRVRIPATGPVYGAGYVRKMLSENGLTSTAPAGHPAVLRGVSAMDVEAYTDEDLEYLVHTLGGNPVMLIPGVGFIPRTSRLMSSQNKNYDIHKRRFLHFIAETFQNNLGFIEQIGNTPEARATLVQTIDFFMQPLFNKGAFDTTGGYPTAVKIKSDSDNNTEEDVLNRVLNCQVAMRIVNIVETAFINVSNVEKTVTIEEL